MEFGKDFSFCLSKTNLKPQSEVLQIKDKIQEQLEDEFDFKKELILTDNTSGKELEKILKDIDVENLFEKIFLDDLKFNHIENESSINTIISTLKVSKDEVIKIINELKNSVKNILNKKQQMIEEAEDRYSNTNIDGIINKVANELNSQKETLVSYAISNPNNFSQEINEIVKNTLIYEIRNRIKDISNNIVDDFKIELKNLNNNSNNFEFDNTWIEKVSENTINLLEKAQNGLNTYLEHRKNSSVDTRVYKAVPTWGRPTPHTCGPGASVRPSFAAAHRPGDTTHSGHDWNVPHPDSPAGT
jgi:arsenate reductase-like glutaredoxin family protein